MFLPENAQICIRRLEEAGFEAYAVGGCVRDDYLGLLPHDYDLCTSATPEQTAAIFADHALAGNLYTVSRAVDAICKYMTEVKR